MMSPFCRRLSLLAYLTLLGAFGCSGSNEGGADSTAIGGTSSPNSSSYGGQTAVNDAGAGGFSPSTTGTMAGGAGGADNAEEEGLCSLKLVCPEELVDEPAIVCDFAVHDSQSIVQYADKAAVEIRGRSSQAYPKKNYGLELRTAAGIDNPANLLGMGKEADWVLDGSWADRSFMRNRLTYALFRDSASNRWAPRARFCELSLNGQAEGIYLLLEKVKRDDDRVNLPDDDGSGGTFIVKQDEQGTLNLSIGVGPDWQLVYPNQGVATPTQTQAAQAWLNSLDSAMRGSNPAALSALFDLDALVDWILVEEFAKNVDAYNLSLHFARTAGKAWVIPWDTDLAYGQPTVRNQTNESPSGWINSRTNLISALSRVSALTTALGPRWRALRAGSFSDAAVTARLDGYQAILTQAAIDRNFAIWPISEVDFQEIYAPYSFYAVSNYPEEVARLRNWITQRLAWIDANIDSYPTQ